MLMHNFSDNNYFMRVCPPIRQRTDITDLAEIRIVFESFAAAEINIIIPGEQDAVLVQIVLAAIQYIGHSGSVVAVHQHLPVPHSHKTHDSRHNAIKTKDAVHNACQG